MKAVLFALCLSSAASSPTKVQTWYVNAKGKIDRDLCIRTQLEDMKIQPNRFMAIKMENCFGKGYGFDTCVRKQGYGDCIKGGMLWGALGAHGTEKVDDVDHQGVADYKRHLAITSNWCSHKRLFEQISNDTETADYHLILEDDVVLKPGFKRAIADFIENYKGQWNSGEKQWEMVQIDPFGSTCDYEKVDEFRGKPIFKPAPHKWLRDMTDRWRQTHQEWIEKHRCNEYWGFHAILVKKSAMLKITKNMEDNPTVPLDWLTGQYDNAITWQPGVALNPEETHADGKRILLPSYCKKEVLRSSLSGFMQKKEDVDDNYVTSGTLHKWADKSQADQRLAVAPQA